MKSFRIFQATILFLMLSVMTLWGINDPQSSRGFASPVKRIKSQAVAACNLMITTATLPDGFTGTLYSQQIMTTGGVGLIF